MEENTLVCMAAVGWLLRMTGTTRNIVCEEAYKGVVLLSLMTSLFEKALVALFY